MQADYSTLAGASHSALLCKTSNMTGLPAEQVCILAMGSHFDRSCRSLRSVRYCCHYVPKGVLKPREQGHEVEEEEERASARHDIHGNDWKVLFIPHEGRSKDEMIEADWGSNKCKVVAK